MAVSKHEEEQQKRREAEAAAAAAAARASKWSKLRNIVAFQSKVRASLSEKAETAETAETAEKAETAAATVAVAQKDEPPIAARAAEVPLVAVVAPRQQHRWQAAAQRATAKPAAAAAAPAAASPRAPDHKVLEVQKLYAVFEAGRKERRTVGGQGGPSLNTMVVRSGGDGSFASVLHMVYPQASARDVKRMCSWVAPKKEAKERTLTAEQKATVKTLFDGFDADGSGSLELSELEEAGWGKAGTDELVEIFNRHDLEGNGNLTLEQFALFCQECSLFDDGILEDTYKKEAAEAAKARLEKLAAEDAKNRVARQRHRRPSLADLSQERRESFTTPFASDDP